MATSISFQTSWLISSSLQERGQDNTSQSNPLFGKLKKELLGANVLCWVKSRIQTAKRSRPEHDASNLLAVTQQFKSSRV
ncbi:hypothetical protein MTR_8g095290 [Medicago truncatula]|uniref:Uncharacterized protein n=1 Tax=Medicago truncatula TaxID=3880 RepID=G7LGG1_MEDTR|nr:hypothetical protein MTR_8g095290 [Medicago truncatula]